MNYILEYWGEINRGNILVPDEVYKQYELLVQDINKPYCVDLEQYDGTYEHHEFIFDEAKAMEPINFIECFVKLSKAPYTGHPMRLMLWQKAAIQATYGFIDKVSRRRRYKEALILISRKNGKSGLSSALATYHLITEKGGQIVVFSNSKNQSTIVFDETKNIILQNSILSRRAKKRKFDLYVPSTFTEMKALANNLKNLDGLNVSVGYGDEIHAMDTSEVYDLIKQSQSLKPEPLIIFTTTNGFKRECFFDDKVSYAKNTLYKIDGFNDYTFLSFLYAMKDEGQLKDKKYWILANPSLGDIRPFTELDNAVKQAHADITFKPTLLTKYFNLPSNKLAAWLDYDQMINEETFDIEDFKGSYCITGTDLSEICDLTCITILFYKPETKAFYIYQKYFMPKDLVETKTRTDKVPYDYWVKKGFIIANGTTRIDHEGVVNWFDEFIRDYELYPVYNGFDRWGSNEFVKLMNNRGYDVTEVIQGYKTFTLPIKSLKSEFLDKKIIYNNNPVFRYCLTNVVIESDENGNQRPIKPKNQKQRIDGFMALLDAYVVYYNNMSDFINML